MMISSVSMAKTFSKDSAAIGGISAGAKAEYIKSIYGEPNKILFNEEKTIETWHYGDSFQISMKSGEAASIISSGNNGLTTPEGIGVGMKKRSMTSKYGKPQSKEKYGKRAIYMYELDNGTKMYFIVNNEIITEMRLIK